MAGLAGCGTGPSPSPATLVPNHFAESGLTFDYPAGWREFHYENTSSFSSVIAYLATVDVKDPCTRTPNSISCGAGYVLAPGTLVVRVESASFPGFNILDVPPGARPITVDGLPGYVEDVEVLGDTGATASRSWSIAMPGSVDNDYRVTADVRTPNEGALLDLVDGIVKRIRYDPPVMPLPTDPAAAGKAVETALAVLAKGSDPSWACFPASGSRTLRVASLPNGPPLTTPQVATCTTAIEATPLQLWRMTLEMRLPRPDANAGLGTRMIVWVGADGQPGSSSGESLETPAP